MKAAAESPAQPVPATGGEVLVRVQDMVKHFPVGAGLFGGQVVHAVDGVSFEIQAGETLGLGVPPPTPSWGAMAADGFHALELAPHIVLAPAIALSLTLMAFNFVGDGLRDALDPRMRR